MLQEYIFVTEMTVLFETTIYMKIINSDSLPGVYSE